MESNKKNFERKFWFLFSRERPRFVLIGKVGKAFFDKTKLPPKFLIPKTQKILEFGIEKYKFYFL